MSAQHLRRAAVAIGLCGALAVLLAGPAVAQAHVPFVESAAPSDANGTTRVPYPQAQTLPPPTISRAVYGYLSPAEQFDSYTFTVPVEVTTEVGLIVPKRAGLQNFRPTLEIYSEGTDTRVVVPDPGANPRAQFYEPFSAATFWDGPKKTVAFKPGDRYFIVVRPSADGRKSGAYVLTFSGAEKFTAADWLSTAADMPTIWLGSWAGGPARPGAYACCVLLVVLFVVAVSLWVWRRVRRRRRAATPDPPPAIAEQPAQDTSTTTAQEPSDPNRDSSGQ